MKGFTSIAATALIVGLAAAHPSSGLEKRAPAKGKYISDCVDKSHIALTFDDGPAEFTMELISKLNAGGHKATFFCNGDNYGKIEEHGDALNAMLAGGHQIASHTWSHAHLLDPATDVKLEMTKLEVAFKTLIGKVPTYMRPPFLEYDDTTLATMGSLGYVVAGVSIDTFDWRDNSIDPDLPVKNFKDAYAKGGTISLNHDPESITVDHVAPAIMAYLDTLGKKSVTVGTCLGEPESAW